MREKRENKWNNILESASSLIKLRKVFQYYKRGGGVLYDNHFQCMSPRGEGALSTPIIFNVCRRGERGGGVLRDNHFQCMSPRGGGGGAFSTTIISCVIHLPEGGTFSTTIISSVIHVPEGGAFSTTIIFSVCPRGG